MLAMGGRMIKRSLHQLGNEGILDFRFIFCALSVKIPRHITNANFTLQICTHAQTMLEN